MTVARAIALLTLVATFTFGPRADAGIDCSEALEVRRLAKIDETNQLCFVCVKDTLKQIVETPGLDIREARVLMIGFFVQARHTRDQYLREWTYHFVVTYKNLVVDPQFGMAEQVVDLQTYFDTMFGGTQRLRVKEWSGEAYLKKWAWLAGFSNSFTFSPQSWFGFLPAEEYVKSHTSVEGRLPVIVLDNGIDNQPRIGRPSSPSDDRMKIRSLRGF